MVVLRVFAERLSGLGMLCGPGDRVELVVAHHDVCVLVVDHGFDQLQYLELLWAAVDEIPDEHRGSVAVVVDP